MYSKETINRFKNPRFGGEMKNPDAVGQVGNMKCGDVMKIFLKIENNIIKDIRFQTFGCIAAIASSDAMCELAKGKTIEEAMNIKYNDILDKLGEIPKQKIHCSVLGTQALKKAIENYKKKQNKKENKQGG
jgi:nitrogen fixation NifU-like protein